MQPIREGGHRADFTRAPCPRRRFSDFRYVDGPLLAKCFAVIFADRFGRRRAMSGLPHRDATAAPELAGRAGAGRARVAPLDGNGRGGLPQLDEIDPWMVDDDWTNCLLVSVRSPIERSHFVVVGDNLISEASLLLAGAPVALCPRDTLAGVLLSLLPQVLSARRCLIAEGVARYQGAAILYRSALLPLSENGVVIDHALGAANHRALRPDEAPVPPTRLIWAPPAN